MDAPSGSFQHPLLELAAVYTASIYTEWPEFVIFTIILLHTVHSIEVQLSSADTSAA